MIILNSIQQLQNHLNGIRNNKITIGFVPTMGALHQGHISLINAAKSECQVVVCSIFVNPTQFNDIKDLKKYPRTLENDCLMLEKANCDIVFAPEIKEMYTFEELELKRQGKEDKSWTQGKTVGFGILDKVMEGAQRPGHFNGVAQVVSKLFRIVQPNKAYFGQKDFQQLAIIRSMTKQLGMPIKIIACPIFREPNGLAMSSRNERLTKEERSLASILFKTLFEVKERVDSLNTKALTEYVESKLKSEPRIQFEYFEIVDSETLLTADGKFQVKSAVACLAVKIATIRLIDNVVLY